MSERKIKRFALGLSLIFHVIILSLPLKFTLDNLKKDVVAKINVEKTPTPSIRAPKHKSTRTKIKSIIKKEPPPLPKIEPVPKIIPNPKPEIREELKEESSPEEEPQPEPDYVVGNEEVAKIEKQKETPDTLSQPEAVAFNPEESKKILQNYYYKIKEKIEKNKRYPVLAKEEEWEGEIHLKFTVNYDGNAQNIQIVKGSPYKILEKAALATIKRAAPFPPIPEEVNKKTIPIKVKIVFRME